MLGHLARPHDGSYCRSLEDASYGWNSAQTAAANRRYWPGAGPREGQLGFLATTPVYGCGDIALNPKWQSLVRY
jgi:hypothetical protein